MTRFIRLLSICVAFATLLVSCEKKEAPPPHPPSPMPMMPGGGMSGGMPGRTSPHDNITMPPSESMRTVIPESVKGKWKGVTLTVVDRQNSSVEDYTTLLGDKLSVPHSDLVIHVTEFVPDFKIDGNVFTSASNQSQNPAVQVFITEKGQEVFKGWLFQKFPTMHPFQHQRYSITLKEGVSA